LFKKRCSILTFPFARDLLMETSGSGAAQWNRPGNDCQNSWGGWNSATWIDQPCKSSYFDQNDAAPWSASTTWQPTNSGGYARSDGTSGWGVLSASQRCEHSALSTRPSADQRSDHNPVKPLPFDFLRALQGDDHSDDDEKQQGGDQQPSDQESTSASGSGLTERTGSSDDEVEQHARKEVTQKEREEAERVVRNAFHDVKERDAMRLKVSTASPTDLQAMLNARLKKQSGR
jgi:hypothetical protein